MIPLEEALENALRKLGLVEPALMLEILAAWEELAGEPWISRARPLYLRQGALVVEATERTAVAFLRYGTGELERRLRGRFGDVIQRVEIRPPARGE